MPQVRRGDAERTGVASSILTELSALLWRERDVLEQLVARLRTERDVDDVESNGLLHSISSLEVHRAITTREVAVEMGLEGEPTLQDLVERAGSEWSAVLAAHRRALLELSAQLRPLLRPVGPRLDANVVTLSPAGRSIQRSLRDFLG